MNSPSAFAFLKAHVEVAWAAVDPRDKPEGDGGGMDGRMVGLVELVAQKNRGQRAAPGIIHFSRLTSASS
ncbi:hypothetical protein RU07_07250 [Agrobacterium tumefaciens]|uniref:Uncharacterized protein n=1 Tax=Agrobacterium tumefaciens TaxID=358 RepID=A0A0D0L254_AGRTU|nr:hypothetical protein RU07_07250 [Agrobacterium tumefaciens]